jgi:PST family polysaccharide transporter
MAIVAGVAFAINGLASQHQALLARRMQFATVAKIDVLSLTMSSAAGVVMALLGWRYWALVGMALVASIVNAVAVWLAIPWVPARPRLRCGVRSMLHFGWMATCNNFVVFFAWNSDNILIGRFWGAEALGLYGRAFQLVTLPILQLNAAISGVAFSALSRLQDDAERLERSFLKGYSLLLSLTIPTTISFALFSEEIVHVVLGAKWMDVAPILRLLVPAALIFALANPFSLLVISTGRARRALRMSAATTPLVIVGIALGLSHGPRGVALGYSLAMALLVFPIVSWSKRGTKITWADLWMTCKKHLVSGLMAGTIGLIVKIALGGAVAPIPHLLIEFGFVFGMYAWTFLIVLKNKDLFMDLLNQAFSRTRTGG